MSKSLIVVVLLELWGKCNNIILASIVKLLEFIKKLEIYTEPTNWRIPNSQNIKLTTENRLEDIMRYKYEL